MVTEVRFKEWRPSEKYTKKPTPKMIGLIMKCSGGLVKNETHANYVLLGIFALVVALSIIFFVSTFSGDKTKIEAPRGSNIIYPPNEPPRLQEPLK